MVGEGPASVRAEDPAAAEDGIPPEFLALIERGREQARLAKAGMRLPPGLEKVREHARRAIAPIKPAGPDTKAEEKFLFTAMEMAASRDLPPYHLVFFLLVDLLGFKNLGRFEKIAWSVPIDFEGTAFLIEDRKFGLGIFARAGEEARAARIATLVGKGVKAARPFFEWMAKEAITASAFNVINNAASLFGRYEHMRDLHSTTRTKLERAKAAHAEDERQLMLILWRRTKGGQSMVSDGMWLVPPQVLILTDQANWLALSTIDAFFGWTEHVFIHLAILQCRVTTGGQVAELVGAEWGVKFKHALDVGDARTKAHFDRMILLRQQLRNFVAHGAFGKEGQAFHFHTKVGAVPVAFGPSKSKNKFGLTEKLGFDDAEALSAIGDFVRHLWSGGRLPARGYVQESALPTILTMASDGKYAEAMRSVEAMEELVDDLLERQDAYSNMDW